MLLSKCPQVHSNCFKKSRQATKPMISRRVAIADSSSIVSYEYMEMFAAYVCSEAPLRAACIAHAVLPPIDEQLAIVNTMHNLQTECDMSGFQGAVMRLLIAKDGAALTALLENIAALQHASDNIDAILHYIQEMLMDDAKSNVL